MSLALYPSRVRSNDLLDLTCASDEAFTTDTLRVGAELVDLSLFLGGKFSKWEPLSRDSPIRSLSGLASLGQSGVATHPKHLPVIRATKQQEVALIKV
jgi:hypothetical protein